MILPQNDGVGHLSRTDENIRPGQDRLDTLDVGQTYVKD